MKQKAKDGAIIGATVGLLTGGIGGAVVGGVGGALIGGNLNKAKEKFKYKKHKKDNILDLM
jgi:uncharacterized membrane protein